MIFPLQRNINGVLLLHNVIYILGIRRQLLSAHDRIHQYQEHPRTFPRKKRDLHAKSS